MSTQKNVDFLILFPHAVFIWGVKLSLLVFLSNFSSQINLYLMYSEKLHDQKLKHLFNHMNLHGTLKKKNRAIVSYPADKKWLITLLC